jgi:hypothetical protein
VKKKRWHVGSNCNDEKDAYLLFLSGAGNKIAKTSAFPNSCGGQLIWEQGRWGKWKKAATFLRILST